MPDTYEQFVKNLVLFAPNKTGAKKSVSKGLIRLEFTVLNKDTISIFGLATDDFVSVRMNAEVAVPDAKALFTVPLLKAVTRDEFIGYWTPEQFKTGILGPPDEPYDPDFDKRFWLEHVYGSIMDDAQLLMISGMSFNPERLRKLALLEPRGQEVTFRFVEWADRSLIRWYTDNARGVYAPTGMW